VSPASFEQHRGDHVSRVSRRFATIAVAVIISLPLLVFEVAGTSVAAGGHTVGATKTIEVYATYYGWYDNTPPGCQTAYKPYCAGGTGTFEDPITFASYKKEFPVGTVLYYPTIEKYVVMGDECQECQADWVGKGPDGGPHLYHLDVWIGGKGGNEFDVINCEDALTQGTPAGSPLLTPFIENPPKDLPVSSEPIFDTDTNHCFGGLTTATTHGRYENAASTTCLDEAEAKANTPATLAPCSDSRSENLGFDGAFFVANHLCLQLEGTGYGSHLDWANCNGNDREQWEIDTDGTIAWIQYLRCIGVSARSVILSPCTGKPTVKWAFLSETVP
jgi:hypothetical protein